MKNDEVNSKTGEGDNSWVFPTRKPTEEQKRDLVSRMAEIGVRAVWENFTYTFGGKTYLQKSGGPIGARITMATARIIMQAWGNKYREILNKCGLENWLSGSYVDDARQGTQAVKKGNRYNFETEKMEFRDEALREDKEKSMGGESTNKRMARICLPIMNSINPDLVFTVEVPEDFSNGRLPTLDFDMEIVGWEISHSYFEKKMKTPYLIMEKSAMGEQQRYSILSNELLRRLSNISHGIVMSERLQIVEKFIVQLKNSGYTRKQAREAVTCGLVGFRNKVEKRKTMGEDFYRSAASTLKSRVKKKLTAKTSWYKKRKTGEENKIGRGKQKHGKEGEKKKQCEGKTTAKAVIYVPYTHGSKLAKLMREAEAKLEDLTGYRLKVVERGGTKLENILHKSNLWEGKDCQRKNCLLCDTKLKTGKNTRQSCSKRNAVYETWCATCENRDRDEKHGSGGDESGSEGKKSEITLHKYIGETSRSVHERGMENLLDARSLNSGSHILKHYLESHEMEELDQIEFNMKVLRFPKTAFERQIYESVAIQENRLHNLLNSKSEFNRCAIPRLTLKMGEREMKEESDRRKEEMKNEEELEEKIRALRKKRNRQRGNARGLPKRKKQRIDLEDKTEVLPEVMPDCEMKPKNITEKRLVRQWDEALEANPRQKKQRKIWDYCNSVT